MSVHENRSARALEPKEGKPRWAGALAVVSAVANVLRSLREFVQHWVDPDQIATGA
ncbi:hypothetical protein OHB05_39680 [Streptomyces sp. NBC_00638]|uniref:hypothetical protein n=1 Tax=unclassified Streptomyces TaxID=2593676 RepID=UPI002259DC3E|nr:hypothetical protein [Streptomyces sp. NBC_00638]MCX5008659.1 hypothetical protein [Streptomyces sp. NBC_00638]